ncbi:MAG: toxin-antitoxin system YwqK family antitoxin [Spirochaetales bacterium]|nr:toxin-antitoxin system YwqK family antitoxin [Spirochaetales bacterium]
MKRIMLISIIICICTTLFSQSIDYFKKTGERIRKEIYNNQQYSTYLAERKKVLGPDSQLIPKLEKIAMEDIQKLERELVTLQTSYDKRLSDWNRRKPLNKLKEGLTSSTKILLKAVDVKEAFGILKQTADSIRRGVVNIDEVLKPKKLILLVNNAINTITENIKQMENLLGAVVSSLRGLLRNPADILGFVKRLMTLDEIKSFYMARLNTMVLSAYTAKIDSVLGKKTKSILGSLKNDTMSKLKERVDSTIKKSINIDSLSAKNKILTTIGKDLAKLATGEIAGYSEGDFTGIIESYLPGAGDSMEPAIMAIVQKAVGNQQKNLKIDDYKSFIENSVQSYLSDESELGLMLKDINTIKKNQSVSSDEAVRIWLDSNQQQPEKETSTSTSNSTDIPQDIKDFIAMHQSEPLGPDPKVDEYPKVHIDSSWKKVKNLSNEAYRDAKGNEAGIWFELGSNGKVVFKKYYTPEGKYTMTFDNDGQKYMEKLEDKNGNKGYGIEWYKNKYRKSYTVYSNLSEKTGIQKTYSDTGILTGEGPVVKNKKEGRWITFHKSNGSVYLVGDFSQGNRNGTIYYFHDNGTLKEIAEFIDGKQDGAFTSYYSNGNINVQGTYVQGVKQGEWKTYGDDGSLFSTSIYENGKVVSKDSVF